MEDAELVQSRADFAADAPEAEQARRKEAMTLFLQSPAVAIERYPDLEEGLCFFFLHSTNPYAGIPGNSPPAHEAAFENWEAARRWAAAVMEKISASGETGAEGG